MSDYTVSQIYPSDARAMEQMEALLHAEGIRRDPHLDYTCGIYDDDCNIIAAGSCFSNTLRCIAVSHEHQGEGLMNEIISHLIDYQFRRNNTHLFLYTKGNSAKFFGNLGFYEIVRIGREIVFMENKREGFHDYIQKLKTESAGYDDSASLNGGGRIGAVVMNANPFTLGHQYLVESAAAQCDLLHLFVVSEDASLIPFSVRKRLVAEGTAHIRNICFHESGPYIISNATFPSYFQKDENAVIESHARLDLAVFSKIAQSLGITDRFIGEEPESVTTGIYNKIMTSYLPEYGVSCHVIERLQEKESLRPISASNVRKAIKNGDKSLLERLVPKTTSDFFISEEAYPVIERIRNEENVAHY